MFMSFYLLTLPVAVCNRVSQKNFFCYMIILRWSS